MRNLLALLLFMPSLCLAQLPEYVPTDGLVAWYPLDGNVTDESTLGLNGTMDGTTPGTNRFGEAGKALYFDGSASVTCPSQNFPNGLTVSLWVQESEITGVSGFVFKYDGDYGGADNVIERTFAVYRHGNGLGYRYYATASETGVAYEDCPTQAVGSLDWVHLTAVFGLDGIQYYVNGLLDTEYTFNTIGGYHTSDVPITLGSGYPTAGDTNKLIGTLDDIGIWNRTLNPAEVMALYIGTPLEYGCTDSTACNFDPLSNSDDGSCEYGCLYCGEGTVWDSTLAQCISIAPPCAPSCGEGTIWDPVNEECIIAIPADLNYDGCVSVNDLLVLLAVHGTCPPYPEWPDEPTDTTWTCGAPLTYWDYDYATVLIGDQCWFAENLRTELYSNGDSIPNVSANGDWAELLFGAFCTYANSTLNNEEYGNLYNLNAVQHQSALCPSEWHVPTDAEWSLLEGFIEDQDLNSGTALKSTSGWYSNGNGLDNFDFSGLPSGFRGSSSGGFFQLTRTTYFWSSTPGPAGAWARSLLYQSTEIGRNSWHYQHGFSVRCLKD